MSEERFYMALSHLKNAYVEKYQASKSLEILDNDISIYISELQQQNKELQDKLIDKQKTTNYLIEWIFLNTGIKIEETEITDKEIEILERSDKDEDIK